MSISLAAGAAVLFGVGTYLVLQRSLTRIIIGASLLAHGANLLLLLAGGRAGSPPVIDGRDPAVLADGVTPGAVADPLPQALALTAIVISFGVTAFLLTLAYRRFGLERTDEVEDDIEDRRIARLEQAEENA